MANDRLLGALAGFASQVSTELDAATVRAGKVALIDCAAVALGALDHPAAIVARRYARHAQVARGARLWGSGETVTAEAAALANGVPLRGYDYNDLYIGRSGGHPSDMVPGALALAEWRGIGGARVLAGLALGFEVTLAFFDNAELHAGGWDYPNVVAIGATCGFARMLGLDEAQTREALAITVIAHMASDEIESGELNARGDLTMWKRFNGSDAVRQSIYACLLADAGAEGAVRPFEGRTAFLSKLGEGGLDAERLIATLAATKHLSRIGDVTYKRWPVGSRAQSAIQAALAVHAQLPDPQAAHGAKRVTVHADPQVYDHLVARRAEPYAPFSRETADHALAYIVAAAVLDGRIGVESFDPARVNEPARRAFLAQKVTAIADPALAGGGKAGFLARVEVELADGRVVRGEARPPPGHAKQPFSDAEFAAKLRENVTPHLGAARAEAILAAIAHFERAPDPRALVGLYVAPPAARIDTPRQ